MNPPDRRIALYSAAPVAMRSNVALPMLAEAADHYRQHRNAFIAWARNEFGVDPEEAKDAFQEAVCIFCEQQASGRLGEVPNVKTYLFAIGRHKILSHLRSKKIRGNHLNGYAIHMGHGQTMTAQEIMERNEDLEKVKAELERLSDDDRRVLQLYYIDRMDMREIAEAMGYKNANVAKKKKCIAMKRLMDHVKKGIVPMRDK